MKIETEKVQKFLQQIKYNLKGYADTIRSGDDDWPDSLLKSFELDDEEINKFIVLELTEKLDDPYADKGSKEPYYLKEADLIIQRIEDGTATQSDSMRYYQVKLYAWLKRTYKEQIDKGLQHDDQDTIHVITNLALDNQHWRELETKYFHSFSKVYEDITSELNTIRADLRKRSEQTKLDL